MIKRPAKPILESKYERFKYRLEEISNIWSERNLTLFYLGVGTGYRIQDIIDLTISDIKEALSNEEFNIQEKKQYRAWKAKNIKYPQSLKKAPDKRTHKILPPLEAILRKYIKGKKNSEYAFPSQKGEGSGYLRPQSYSDILKKVAADKEIKLNNITGHSLRKTYARRLYDVKRDIEYVRLALGHSSIEITKKYLGIEDDVKEDAAKIAAGKL